MALASRRGWGAPGSKAAAESHKWYLDKVEGAIEEPASRKLAPLSFIPAAIFHHCPPPDVAANSVSQTPLPHQKHVETSLPGGVLLGTKHGPSVRGREQRHDKWFRQGLIFFCLCSQRRKFVAEGVWGPWEETPFLCREGWEPQAKAKSCHIYQC